MLLTKVLRHQLGFDGLKPRTLATIQPHVHIVVHIALRNAMCEQAMVAKLCRWVRLQTLLEAQAKSTVCLCALLYTSTWNESSPHCLTE